MYNIAAGGAIARARARPGNLRETGPGGGRRAGDQEPIGSQKCSRKVFMPSTRGPSSKGRWPG